ncbi:MAG: hypothetical protein JWR62_2169 [Modestobacter sp.]|nr:hypothetical protein [Modestobacter sp.]
MSLHSRGGAPRGDSPDPGPGDPRHRPVVLHTAARPPTRSRPGLGPGPVATAVGSVVLLVATVTTAWAGWRASAPEPRTDAATSLPVVPLPALDEPGSQGGRLSEPGPPVELEPSPVPWTQRPSPTTASTTLPPRPLSPTGMARRADPPSASPTTWAATDGASSIPVAEPREQTGRSSGTVGEPPTAPVPAGPPAPEPGTMEVPVPAPPGTPVPADPPAATRTEGPQDDAPEADSRRGAEDRTGTGADDADRRDDGTRHDDTRNHDTRDHDTPDEHTRDDDTRNHDTRHDDTPDEHTPDDDTRNHDTRNHDSRDRHPDAPRPTPTATPEDGTVCTDPDGRPV